MALIRQENKILIIKIKSYINDYGGWQIIAIVNHDRNKRGGVG